MDVVSTLEVMMFLNIKVTAFDVERLVAANPELTNVEVEFDENTVADALQRFGDWDENEDEFDYEDDKAGEDENVDADENIYMQMIEERKEK